VLRWATVHTGDPSEADDLAQDALVRVVRGLGGFRGQARFTSWVYRVVASAALDRGRRLGRRERREEGPEMLETATVAEEPRPGDVDKERLLDRVRECFLGLAGRQREVFELCELQGLDSVEAGDLLGIAPATVRVTLLRARRTVREEILRTDPELVEAFLS
jgi:RNA polymerase sigma-70 factor (ECF subfamily)